MLEPQIVTHSTKMVTHKLPFMVIDYPICDSLLIALPASGTVSELKIIVRLFFEGVNAL